MLVVELNYLVNMLDSVGQLGNISALARHYSSVIEEAIWSTTVGHFRCQHPALYLSLSSW